MTPVATDRSDRWVGQTLEERYRILEVLGRGGMGVVYLAEQLRVGRQLAIKVVNVHESRATAVQRLEREARTVTLIGHENIVGIFDFGVAENGSAFLVMERLIGQTVEERLRAQWSVFAARRVCHCDSSGVCAGSGAPLRCCPSRHQARQRVFVYALGAKGFC